MHCLEKVVSAKKLNLNNKFVKEKKIINARTSFCEAQPNILCVILKYGLKLW